MFKRLVLAIMSQLSHLSPTNCSQVKMILFVESWQWQVAREGSRERYIKPKKQHSHRRGPIHICLRYW